MDEGYRERALTHYVGASWRAPLSVRMHPLAQAGLAVVLAGREDCARAGAAARAAQGAWAALPVPARLAALRRMAAALPDRDSDLKSGFVAGIAAEAVAPRFPSGGVALICARELASGGFACRIGAALAMGRTVIAVPPLIAPLGPIVLAEAADKSGLAAGVFNLLQAEAAEIRDLLGDLVQDPDL